MMKDLVLVYEWYVKDDWYGKRYRALLSVKTLEGFQTKTEANKHKTKFKNLIKNKFDYRKWGLPSKIANKDLIVGERKTFISYTYCANGPSLAFDHYNFNLEDLK